MPPSLSVTRFSICRLIGHNGGVEGYDDDVFYSPSRHATTVVFGNGDNPSDNSGAQLTPSLEYRRRRVSESVGTLGVAGAQRQPPLDRSRNGPKYSPVTDTSCPTKGALQTGTLIVSSSGETQEDHLLVV